MYFLLLFCLCLLQVFGLIPNINVKLNDLIVYDKVVQSQLTGLEQLMFKDGYNLTFSSQEQNVQGCYLFDLFELELAHVGYTKLTINLVNKNYNETIVLARGPEIINKQQDVAYYSGNVTEQSYVLQAIAPSQFVYYLKCSGQVSSDKNFKSIVKFGIFFVSEVESAIYFDFIAVCDSKYNLVSFNVSSLLLILIAFFLVYVFTKFQKIRGFDTQFYGFSILWWFCFFYLAAVVILELATFYYLIAAQQIITALSMPLSFFGGIFFFGEILSLVYPLKNFFRKKIFFSRGIFRVQDLVSFLLSSIQIFFYWYTSRSWYMNDILALSMIQSLLKIFKFKSLKNGTIFLSACFIVDIIALITVDTIPLPSIVNSIQCVFSSPFYLQLPQIGSTKINQNCVQIPITGLVFPGMFISYLIRFDKSEIRNKNSNIYFVSSFFSFVIGALAWFIPYTLNIMLPFSTFTYPLIILTILLFAFRRSEVKILWEGDFHDNELYENLHKQQLKYLEQNSYSRHTPNSQNKTPQLSHTSSEESWKKRVFQGLSVQESQKFRNSNLALSLQENQIPNNNNAPNSPLNRKPSEFFQSLQQDNSVQNQKMENNSQFVLIQEQPGSQDSDINLNNNQNKQQNSKQDQIQQQDNNTQNQEQNKEQFIEI